MVTHSVRSLTILGLLVALLPSSLRGQKKVYTEKEIQEIHRQAIVLDGHSDSPWWILDGGVDFGARRPDGHMDLPRIREGGLDGQFFSIFVDPKYLPHHSANRALRLIDAVYETIARNPDRMELATSADDVRRIAKKGKLATLMGIEGGHAVEDDLGLLRMFHRLGVRYMTLTWNNTNNWADANADSARWGGLNDFGRQVVGEMERIGMIVDISHVADSTFWDVMEIARKPVIASHSSARALANHRRNMTDEMLRAVAKNGGVVCVNFFSAFVSDEFRERMRAKREAVAAQVDSLRALYPENPTLADLEEDRFLWRVYMRELEPVPLQTLIDHIDHIARVAGVDHVGLGSDFDGVTALPAGVEDVRQLPNLTRALLQRGYSKKDVQKILGGNLLRVLEEVVGR